MLLRYFPNWIRRKNHLRIINQTLETFILMKQQRCRRITNYRFQLQFTYNFSVIHHLSPVIDRLCFCAPVSLLFSFFLQLAQNLLLIISFFLSLLFELKHKEKKKDQRAYVQNMTSCVYICGAHTGKSALLTFSHKSFQSLKTITVSMERNGRRKKKLANHHHHQCEMEMLYATG